MKTSMMLMSLSLMMKNKLNLAKQKHIRQCDCLGYENKIYENHVKTSLQCIALNSFRDL